jgi:hypothetical protein
LLFIFSRGYGDRKTGLGTAVLGEALARGLKGRWLSQAGWLRDIKASWNGGPDREDEVFSRAADAEILLFDDFGGVEGGHRREKPWATTPSPPSPVSSPSGAACAPSRTAPERGR